MDAPVYCIVWNYKHCLILAFVFASAQCATADNSTAPVDVAVVLNNVAHAGAARDKALKRGYGSVRIIFHKCSRGAQPIPREEADALRSKGVFLEKSPDVCANLMDITWYSRGEWLRYDRTISGHIGEDGQKYDLCEPSGSLIVCTNTSVSIYYNAYDSRAYINSAPIHFFDYNGLMLAFDLSRLYNVVPHKSNHDLLMGHDSSRMVACEDVHNGIPCIRIEYTRPRRVLSADIYEDHIAKYWISPEQGFSIIEYIGRVTTFTGDVSTSEVTSEYSAEYEQAPSASDVWLLKKMHRRDNIVAEQEMWAEFSNQDVNYDASPEMFNFQGMGVPRGTPIFDKRKNGSTEVIEYVDGMHVGLDMININKRNDDPDKSDD